MTVTITQTLILAYSSTEDEPISQASMYLFSLALAHTKYVQVRTGLTYVVWVYHLYQVGAFYNCLVN